VRALDHSAMSTFTASAELAHEPHQFFDVALIPCREHRSGEPFACLVDGIGHGFALRRHGGLTDPAIGRGGLTLDKTDAFQLCDLTADRRVIAPDPVGEIDDSDRASPFDDNEQRKQRTIQRYAGFPNHHLVTLGAVHNTDDVDQ
jgi:hypothetical protein